MKSLKNFISSGVIQFLLLWMKAGDLEKGLVALCRESFWRRAGIGRFAFAMSERERGRSERIVDFLEYRMFVNVVESHGLMSYYFLSPQVPRACQKIIPTGGVMLDIGSNMGHWAMYAASKVGPQGRVIAFEPNPVNRQMLNRSIEVSRFQERVKTEAFALWNESGKTMDFHLSGDPHNSGISSLKKYELLGNSPKSIQVSTMTGDDYFKKEGIEWIDFMKIDVERAELEVLTGMKETLLKKKIGWVHLETEKNSEAWRLLGECGYQCRGRILGDEEPIDVENLPDHTFGDYLFEIGSRKSS